MNYNSKGRNLSGDDAEIHACCLLLPHLRVLRVGGSWQTSGSNSVKVICCNYVLWKVKSNMQCGLWYQACVSWGADLHVPSSRSGFVGSDQP